MYIKVNNIPRHIFRVCKGDDADGEFFWRPLNNHYCTRQDDTYEGGRTSFDVREIAHKLGLVPLSYGYLELDHKEVIQQAADAGLILFLDNLDCIFCGEQTTNKLKDGSAGCKICVAEIQSGV